MAAMVEQKQSCVIPDSQTGGFLLEGEEAEEIHECDNGNVLGIRMICVYSHSHSNFKLGLDVPMYSHSTTRILSLYVLVLVLVLALALVLRVSSVNFWGAYAETTSPIDFSLSLGMR